MPLDSVPSTVPADDVREIRAFAVDIEAKTITLIYKRGIKQPNGSVLWSSTNVTRVVSDPALITPAFTLFYPILKGPLYKLGQDAKEFPAGIVR